MYQKKKSAYDHAIDGLLEQLESGTIPWRKPWVSAGVPRNLVSKKEYRGMNVILLAMKGCASPYWLTMKQANQLGGSIRAGEKATWILFWKPNRYTKKTKDEVTGEESISLRSGLICRGYMVFNLMQCNQELIDKYQPQGEPRVIEDLPAAEALWAHYPDRPAYEDSDHAWYRPSEDKIGMPKREAFKEQREFYSTLFHEMIHSTGAKKRLDREGVSGSTYRGSDLYSAEELVAEFGSAMLCGVCGISKPEIVENQAAYLRGWLSKLRLSDNKHMLMHAISQAQKACDHIRAEKQAEETPETPEKEEACGALSSAS